MKDNLIILSIFSGIILFWVLFFNSPIGQDFLSVGYTNTNNNELINYGTHHKEKTHLIGYSVYNHPEFGEINIPNLMDKRICDYKETLKEKTDCLKEYADISKDSSACWDIEDSIEREICIAMSSDDVALCEKLPRAKERDNCILSIAKRPRSIFILSGHLCNKISDLDKGDDCLLNSATALEDATICDKILNINKRDRCYLYIAKLKGGDRKLCERIDMGVNSDLFGKCLTYISE